MARRAEANPPAAGDDLHDRPRDAAQIAPQGFARRFGCDCRACAPRGVRRHGVVLSGIYRYSVLPRGCGRKIYIDSSFLIDYRRRIYRYASSTIGCRIRIYIYASSLIDCERKIFIYPSFTTNYRRRIYRYSSSTRRCEAGIYRYSGFPTDREDRIGRYFHIRKRLFSPLDKIAY